jgi:hypothetical protein
VRDVVAAIEQSKLGYVQPSYTYLASQEPASVGTGTQQTVTCVNMVTTLSDPSKDQRGCGPNQTRGVACGRSLKPRDLYIPFMNG